MIRKAKSKSRRRRSPLIRFSAKLLFQFRVVVDGDSGTRRLCEERMLVLRARGAKAALAEAKRRGKAGQHTYKNSDGNSVHFEFVGVLDLLELGISCEKDEVWYDIVQRVRPMERKDLVLPPEKELNAIYWLTA